MSLNLLNEEEIPNKILIHNNSKIVFFTGEKIKKEDVLKIKVNLREKGFYKDKSKNSFTARYPELVLLVNKENNKKVTIKDMCYESTHAIIKNMVVM